MNIQKLVFIFSLGLFFCQNSRGQRALYVDQLDQILGDSIAEQQLFNYVQANNFQTLLLYSLHRVHITHDLTMRPSNTILADFIHRAKSQYRVTKVGAIGENTTFFQQVIQPYNTSRSLQTERFDLYNLEFEYWNTNSVDTGGYYCNTYLLPNQLPCTVNSAFGYYSTILNQLDTLTRASISPIEIETYIGWATASQLDTITRLVDRLRIHAYVNDPSIAYAYTASRLVDLRVDPTQTDLSIIFSAEPSFMQPWLLSNSMGQAEHIYQDSFRQRVVNNGLNLEGFTYFAYSHLPNIILPNRNLVASTKFFNIRATVNHIVIETTFPQYEVLIYDLLGRLQVHYPNSSPKQIAIQNLSKGIYLLVLRTGSNQETFQFIKN